MEVRKVFVEFTVDADGSVVNSVVLRSSGHDEFDLEATRAISQMPNWTPGTKDGKAVNIKMQLPIGFKLP